MARYNHILLICLLPLIGDAANEWFPIGGKSASMGYTSTPHRDLWSTHNNQAGMAFCDHPVVGAYFENRFMIRELGYQAVALVLPTKYGSFGTNVVYSGDQNMNNFQAGCGYAKKFGEHFSAGLQIDYLRTFLAEGYGLHRTLTFEGGFMARISKELVLGAHIFNPLSAKLATYYDERILTVLNVGLNYKYSEEFDLSVEAVRSSDKPLDIRVGAEYELLKNIFARAGICTRPFQYTFGCGIGIRSVIIDFSASVHQTLGFSPQVSIQYQFQ